MENFANFIINYIEKTKIDGIKGWLNQLHAYEWKTNSGIERYPDGISTSKEFMSNSQIILNVQNNDDIWHIHCEDIRKWGGISTPISFDLALEYKRCTKFLFSNLSNPNLNLTPFPICGNRIAMASKIFYFSDPLNWTIYDSRVGYATHQLVFEYAKILHLPPKSIFPHIPLCLPESRTHRRNPVFTTSGCSNSEINSMKSFIWASHLHRLIANKLNQTSIEKPSHCFSTIPQWELPHVEMVFFVVGDSQWVNVPIVPQEVTPIESRKRGAYAGVCPLCGNPLKIRKSRLTGELYEGCTNYPNCRYKGNRSH